MRFSVSALMAMSASAFEASGLSVPDAQIFAESLVEAEASGVETHGLARLPAYVAALRRGVINPRPKMDFVARGATGTLDGDNGPGPVVARRAMEEAIGLACRFGIGLVAARRSNHFGTAGLFAGMAAAEGMLGLVFSNASATVAPLGACEPGFGTNPLAFAAPSAEGPPFLLDMATSIASRGQLRLAEATGVEIPADWAVKSDGLPATTATEALDGALFSFGGAKGYGIALMVELMSSVLAGAACGREVSSMYGSAGAPAGVGHCFVAIDAGTVRPDGDYRAAYDRFAGAIRSTAAMPGKAAPRMPGEGRTARRMACERDGIALSARLVAELDALAAGLGISGPVPFKDETR